MDTSRAIAMDEICFFANYTVASLSKGEEALLLLRPSVSPRPLVSAREVHLFEELAPRVASIIRFPSY